MSTRTNKRTKTRRKPASKTRSATKAKSRTSPRAGKAEPVRVPTEQLANRHSRYFDIRESPIQGRGAFANRKIRAGTRLVEYAGERISNDEADERYDESRMRRHHTFLFTLTPRTVVDGAVNGNESIYINHSCDPNCEAVIEDGRIWIEAIRTIQEGEELAYDYQYENTGDDEQERFYKCNCGAPNCRGSIMKPAAPPRPKRGTPGRTRRNKSGNKRVKR